MTPGGRLASVAASLAGQEWVFAKTMPDNPHEYCLRRRWVGDDDAFVEAVEFIREAGYEAFFEGRPYTQLDIDDHFYWTMGFPVDETILINRKQIGGHGWATRCGLPPGPTHVNSRIGRTNGRTAVLPRG